MASRADKNDHQRLGLIAGIAAFMTWGLVPVYWKLLTSVPAAEILAHRFIWTTLFLVVVLSWQGRWVEVLANVSSRRTLLYCLSSGLAIAVNWLSFIWAVNAGHIIETSLGYFMTPLVNVLLGAIFLRERLTRLQWIAVLLAASSVAYLTFGYGRFPWIALVLCTSFGLYGLLRKQSGTAATPGLFLETILWTPAAIIYLAILRQKGVLIFGTPHIAVSLILLSSGIVTGLPLVWFGHAAQHLRLITIGFLQYLAPSCSFLLGVFFYHEPFSRGYLITFSVIWIALALFTGEAVFRWRNRRLQVELAGPLVDSTT